MFLDALRMLFGVRKCFIDLLKIISGCFEDVLKLFSDVLKMFSDVFMMLSDVLKMLSGCPQDILRMLP